MVALLRLAREVQLPVIIHCREAEAYLQSQGIPYAKHDIEKDSAAKQRFRELGGKGVPLIVVGRNGVRRQTF